MNIKHSSSIYLILLLNRSNIIKFKIRHTLSGVSVEFRLSYSCTLINEKYIHMLNKELIKFRNENINIMGVCDK